MNRIKISFNRETKKVPPSILGYDQLTDYLRNKAFVNQLPQVFKLYYQDREGDLISIDNDDEPKEELQSFLSDLTNSTTESFKLVIASNVEEA
jgi:hypothetical protein